MELRENIGKNNTEMKYIYLSSVWACRVGIISINTRSCINIDFLNNKNSLWYWNDTIHFRKVRMTIEIS